MLKRIQARYTTQHDLDHLNETGYRPSQDEIDNPNKSWKQINQMRLKYNF